jgi:hypothetical protein
MNITKSKYRFQHTIQNTISICNFQCLYIGFDQYLENDVEKNEADLLSNYSMGTVIVGDENGQDLEEFDFRYKNVLSYGKIKEHIEEYIKFEYIPGTKLINIIYY